MEEQADGDEFTDPLTPHTMISTQLNAVPVSVCVCVCVCVCVRGS